MKLYELTMALCGELESMDPTLIQRARASWNPNHRSLNGGLADQILDRIRTALPTFNDDLKRDAYNEIADSEGLDRVEQDELGLDSMIPEALLDPVIDMLMELEGGGSRSQQFYVH